MRYTISDYKLKTIVDELGEEYKDLLIEHILDEIDEVDADCINPSDLIRLDISVKSKLRTDQRVQKKEKMLSMISFVGLLYALLGLLLMLWEQFKEVVYQNSMLLMSASLIFVGFFVYFVALLMKKITPKYYRGKTQIVSPYEIVNKWKELEALIRELTPSEYSLSLASMVKTLNESKIVSDEDVETIKRLLSARNQIVHNGKSDKLSQSELRTLLSMTDKIIVKLQKIV